MYHPLSSDGVVDDDRFVDDFGSELWRSAGEATNLVDGFLFGWAYLGTDPHERHQQLQRKSPFWIKY